jgi:quinol monooxygenase YgiN
MSRELYWIANLDVAPEHIDDFKKVVSELVAASQKEAGTLSYDYSIAADGRTVHIFERYRDSAAAVSHIEKTVAPLFERFRSHVTSRGVTVYGNPDDAARKLLDKLSPRYMTSFDGFMR